MYSDDRIIQIIPAPENLYVRYYDEMEGYYYVPIIGTALSENGLVRFLDTDDLGEIGFINEDSRNRLFKYNDEKQEYIKF